MKKQQVFKKLRQGILYSLLCLGLSSCSDDNKSESGGIHDPEKPITVTSINPTVGKIREKVIIKGSNFGTDVSKIKVYFKDDTKDREATVIGSNGELIYCIAPRQVAGNNDIKVIVGEKKAEVSDIKFTYTAAETVTTIATDVASGKDEGQLSEVNFKYSTGVGYVGNESVIIFDQESSRVRYLSIPDNSVITLQAGFQGCKPVVTKKLTAVYTAGRAEPHTIYMYTKDSGWAPTRLSELGSLTSVDQNFIGSLTFAEDEEWLYFCSTKGVFGRFNVNTKVTEIINENVDIITSYSNLPSAYHPYERLSCLIYHPIHKCFYLSVRSAYCIYKLDMQGNAEVYAGLSNTAQSVDGYLNEATFTMPSGMTLDGDGNIYVTDGSRAGGHFIRRISIATGYVSTVAGKAVSGLPDINSLTDGANPLEATFRLVTDITYDGEGGFYILDGWGRRLRKYAIE